VARTAHFPSSSGGTSHSSLSAVPNLDESIAELRQIADGRDDILAEAAGITAGSWYASSATHVGYELIGAGMLITAGDGRGLPMDYDELQRWTRESRGAGEPMFAKRLLCAM
jgi:hypothetical protein